MSIKQLIVADLERIEDASLLNQIFDYVQVIKKKKSESPNLNAVLQWAGCIDNSTADDLQRTIAHEFNKIEGEW